MTNAIAIVAAVLLGEARGEGTAGIDAVARVVITRAAERHQAPVQVVTAPRQFSCWSSALVDRMRREKRWDYATLLAGRIHTAPHMIPDRTGGATHFYSGSVVPYWAVGRKPVAVIGGHKFFKLK